MTVRPGPAYPAGWDCASGRTSDRSTIRTFAASATGRTSWIVSDDVPLAGRRAPRRLLERRDERVGPRAHDRHRQHAPEPPDPRPRPLGIAERDRRPGAAGVVDVISG